MTRNRTLITLVAGSLIALAVAGLFFRRPLYAHIDRTICFGAVLAAPPEVLRQPPVDEPTVALNLDDRIALRAAIRAAKRGTTKESMLRKLPAGYREFNIQAKGPLAPIRGSRIEYVLEQYGVDRGDLDKVIEFIFDKDGYLACIESNDDLLNPERKVDLIIDYFP